MTNQQTNFLTKRSIQIVSFLGLLAAALALTDSIADIFDSIFRSAPLYQVLGYILDLFLCVVAFISFIGWLSPKDYKMQLAVSIGFGYQTIYSVYEYIRIWHTPGESMRGPAAWIVFCFLTELFLAGCLIFLIIRILKAKQGGFLLTAGALLLHLLCRHINNIAFYLADVDLWWAFRFTFLHSMLYWMLLLFFLCAHIYQKYHAK